MNGIYANSFFVDVTEIAKRKNGEDWLAWIDLNKCHYSLDFLGQKPILTRRRAMSNNMAQTPLTDSEIRSSLVRLMYVIQKNLSEISIPENHQLIARIFVITEHWDWQLCGSVYDIGEKE